MIEKKAFQECMSKELIGIVYQAVGNASMCWSNIDGAGTFDVKEAGKIAVDLCCMIASEIEAKQGFEGVRKAMKELTTDEKILTCKAWDAGHGINGIALIVSDKRKDMDMYYLCRQIEAVLTGRVSIHGQGRD